MVCVFGGGLCNTAWILVISCVGSLKYYEGGFDRNAYIPEFEDRNHLQKIEIKDLNN